MTKVVHCVSVYLVLMAHVDHTPEADLKYWKLQIRTRTKLKLYQRGIIKLNHQSFSIYICPEEHLNKIEKKTCQKQLINFWFPISVTSSKMDKLLLKKNVFEFREVTKKMFWILFILFDGLKLLLFVNVSRISFFSCFIYLGK